MTAGSAGARRVMLSCVVLRPGAGTHTENRVYDLEWDEGAAGGAMVGRLKPVWTIPATRTAGFSDDGRRVAVQMGPGAVGEGWNSTTTGAFEVGNPSPLETWTRTFYGPRMRFFGNDLVVYDDREVARFDLGARAERFSFVRPPGAIGWALSRDGEHLLMHEGTIATTGKGRNRYSHVVSPAWTRVVNARSGAASPAASPAIATAVAVVPLGRDAFIGPPPEGLGGHFVTYDGASGRRRSLVLPPSVKVQPFGQTVPVRVAAAPGGGTFAVLQNDTVTVYRQKGPDTSWGAFGLPWVWPAGALFFAAAGSVWADARARGRAGGGRGSWSGGCLAFACRRWWCGGRVGLVRWRCWGGW